MTEIIRLRTDEVYQAHKNRSKLHTVLIKCFTPARNFAICHIDQRAILARILVKTSDDGVEFLSLADSCIGYVNVYATK